MISKDLILDDENDLKISAGDWAIEQSDDQNIKAIIQAKKGQFYEFPLLGYGISDRINAPIRKNVEIKDVRQALRRDDYNIKRLVIEDDFTIFVDAVKEK